MSIIKVNGVTKIFGPQAQRALTLLKQGWSRERLATEKQATVAVNQVSFSVEPGEIFVIMGLSGSGKSTLVRMLNRLIEPTDGDIWLKDRNISKLSESELREVRRKTIGMVFQKFALFPHRTVLDNAAYGLEIQGMAKEERYRKAREALGLVGLEGWEQKYPDELSGGMQQRVGLARALANDPDVLLMDEAFSALDPLIRRDMQDELLELQQKMHKTIIFITHDLDEALRIGDRIALLKDGKLIQIGTPEQMLMDPADEYVERFVEGVDLSKVLTAAHIMRRPETVSLDRGPRVALQLMRDIGISTLFVVGKDKSLQGVVTAEQASEAARGGKSLQEVMFTDVPTVSPDVLLNDLFALSGEAKLPIAVVQPDGRLMGAIVRGAVLGALAGNVPNGTNEATGADATATDTEGMVMSHATADR
ncbi:glycine betaine/L-proline ABC transporter ATP-binding protein [Paenibacillus melissococcoides]|uniref:Quaternary amine transport ATP-binding protein n=1 Tax=Paenibacillus melissococcoides TaxID=2912268 RepID=A0ABN8TY37_9BACL|nr:MULTISPECIES: glycine betaine/L-proline ABC transporter ATP-binding protein [Paenibacillus]MEB9893307.1 glycine betaine/L-proline ABC transporter ATP-binding protein [Bacillus cereus]CAH8243523.1 glycine betaine/L-proline ABC transporter ATP-binding protein [Paenibacillus melissococcoides]CAH8704760.1 glycine betaine/L-proline ABC transporter ATP-binding protein [Paenibacillus melissococcoides]CAH8707987.1 glycine betaine/L-proline ABC transporter ATP-binding protein [Paenibacillus melissoco